MVFFAGRNEFYKIVLADSAVYNLVIGDNAAERIEYRVKNKSLQWRIGVALRCRYAVHYGLKNFRHADTGLAGGADYIRGVASEQIDNLVLDLVGLCAVKVYLVDYRNNLKVVFKGHVKI